MGQSHEAPRRQALWQRELQGYSTLAVGLQLRIEEGRFLQVLAQLNGFLLCLYLFVIRYFECTDSIFNTIKNFGLFHHSRLRNCHRGFRHHPTLRADPDATTTCHPALREQQMVEITEVERHYRLIF